MRTTIYIPDALAKRLSTHQLNFSVVCVRALAEEADHLDELRQTALAEWYASMCELPVP